MTGRNKNAPMKYGAFLFCSKSEGLPRVLDGAGFAHDDLLSLKKVLLNFFGGEVGV